jgi:hypothetical protein
LHDEPSVRRVGVIRSRDLRTVTLDDIFTKPEQQA